MHPQSLPRRYLDALGGDVDHALADARADVAALQATLAGTAGDKPPDAAWIRWCLEHAYRLPVTQPHAAVMPTLKPLQRQHMTPRVLHRSLGRQLLGLFVYRPAARLLRGLQILSGRVERT
ncbi:hypothetical protein [Immundisolibacter sp.]|uniref:hypothetical protein n=1 Tax=Immundisolibacter sp. TaxID=1934948 RepID=UPI003F84A6B9